MRAHYLVEYMRLASESTATPLDLQVESTPDLHFTIKSADLASRWQLLYVAIRDSAILRGKDIRLSGNNGRPLRWLIDVRRLFLNADVLEAFAEIFCTHFAHRLPFQVGGMETSAIPFVTAILLKMSARGTPINGFMIRKERKLYGTGNHIEGIINELPIILVDDIVNSGGSLEKALLALEQENRAADMAFVLVDYHSETGNIWRERRKMVVRSVFNLADFGLAVKKNKKRQANVIFRNIWSFNSPNANFFHRVPKSFPATDGIRVYFGSDCGTFWCLNADDGSVVWRFEVNSGGSKNIWSAPAIDRGRVYFGSYDGNVYCLSAETGTELWRHIAADWIGSSPALAPELNLLFIGLEFSIEGKCGSIVALDLDTGETVWQHMTRRFTHASPAYWKERQLVACGSNDNEMFLFDARTGDLRWRFTTRGSIRHAPAFDTKRGHLVTGCAQGYVYIVDVDTGIEVWSFKTNNSIYTIPLVVGNAAYVGSTDKNLYVLDLNDKIVKKTIFVGSMIFCPPRLLDGRIYFGACNGKVYELDRFTAEITGVHQLVDAVTNALTYSPTTGYLYALTYMNQLFAFSRVCTETTTANAEHGTT